MQITLVDIFVEAYFLKGIWENNLDENWYTRARKEKFS